MKRPNLKQDLIQLINDFHSTTEKDNYILSLFDDKLYEEGVECSDELAFIIGYM